MALVVGSGLCGPSGPQSGGQCEAGGLGAVTPPPLPLRRGRGGTTELPMMPRFTTEPMATLLPSHDSVW